MNASKPKLIDFRMNILRKDEDPGLKRRRELFQVISLKEAFPSSVFLFKKRKIPKSNYMAVSQKINEPSLVCLVSNVSFFLVQYAFSSIIFLAKITQVALKKHSFLRW